MGDNDKRPQTLVEAVENLRAAFRPIVDKIRKPILAMLDWLLKMLESKGGKR